MKTLAILLGEHPCIVNIVFSPMTVHYREVLLYSCTVDGVVKPLPQTFYYNLKPFEKGQVQAPSHCSVIIQLCIFHSFTK